MTRNDHQNMLTQEVELLSRRSKNTVRQWLADGLVDYFAHKIPEAFFPHQYVVAFDNPIETLLDTYRSGAQRLKSGLRAGILAATVHVRANSNESGRLTQPQRLAMLRVLCNLVPQTYCFEAASTLIGAVTPPSSSLAPPEHKEDAFALVLRCVVDLAIHGDESTEWSFAVRSDLESQIIYLTTRDEFRDCYLPICVHALMSVNPESFYVHKDLFGERMARLHLTDPSELQHAYQTAELIVTKGLSYFRKYANQLSLGDGKDHDAWIFKALMHENSPYTMLRLDNDATTVRLFRKERAGVHQTNNPYVYLRSPALIYLNVRPHNLKDALTARLGVPVKIPLHLGSVMSAFLSGKENLLEDAPN